MVDRKRRYRGDYGNEDYFPKRQRRAVPVPHAALVAVRRSRRLQHLPPTHGVPAHPGHGLPAPPITQNSRLLQLPGEILNQIYGLLLDDWSHFHRVNNVARAVHDIIAPNYVTNQPAIDNAPYPMLLTHHSAFDPGRVDPSHIILGLLPHIQNMHRFHYQNMRARLLWPGQICRQIRAEHRSFQATRILPFVHIAEAENFMRVFYPNSDPNDPASSQYHGMAPYFALPWTTNRLWEMLPYIDWYRRNLANVAISPRIWCCLPNVPAGHWAHAARLRHVPFQPLPARSILSYMQSGTGHNIVQVRVRSHGLPYPHSHIAKIEIWLTGGDEVNWVFPHNWMWPAPGLPADMVFPLTEHHWRLEQLQTFLHLTGLDSVDIRGRWEVAIGVRGRQAQAGRGV